MDLATKENLKMINPMVMDDIYIKMERFFKVNLLMEKLKEKEHIISQMEY